MEAATVAAAAACAAAALSLINVGYQAYLANRSEHRRWLRETLPETLLSFSRASHEMQHAWFFCAKEIRALPHDERERRSMDAAADAFRWLDRIQLMGNPELISAAMDVLHTIENGRAYLITTIDGSEYSLDQERALYWAYAEAEHAFLTVARRTMGLAAPPVPPGLENWRKASP